MDTRTHEWSGRAVLHVDMDAFFAAVEQLDHPEWRGRPVIVGGSSTGRGVVSTASYEARAFGIHSAMPSVQAARLCPDAIWARPRFDRYREFSHLIREIFLSVTPRVEQVSIDEAYLDVTPAPHDPLDPVEVARGIQQRVDALGLSCSAGVATSKTVAKIASDRDKPHGITVVRPGQERAFLSPLPVVLLPGVGGTTASRLREAGIRTIGDLAALDEPTATALLGSAGPTLAARAQGVDPRSVSGETDAKSVSHERTFPADIRGRDEVDAVLRGLVSDVASRLRRGGQQGRTLTVKLRYGDFTTKTASTTLTGPTDLESVLLPAARSALHRVWSPGTGLRLLGFGVSGLGRADEQLDLLEGGQEPRTERARSLARSVDAVRERFGSDAISFGSRTRRQDPDETE